MFYNIRTTFWRNTSVLRKKYETLEAICSVFVRYAWRHIQKDVKPLQTSVSYHNLIGGKKIVAQWQSLRFYLKQNLCGHAMHSNAKMRKFAARLSNLFKLYPDIAIRGLSTVVHTIIAISPSLESVFFFGGGA
jgi:hypothetical protein